MVIIGPNQHFQKPVKSKAQNRLSFRGKNNSLSAQNAANDTLQLSNKSQSDIRFAANKANMAKSLGNKLKKAGQELVNKGKEDETWVCNLVILALLVVQQAVLAILTSYYNG